MNDREENFDELPDEENDDGSRMTRQHDLYLRAVNNPARHRILELVSASPCAEADLVSRLLDENLIEDKKALSYHLDYLLKADCIEIKQDEESGESVVNITPGGQVIDHLE
ncbi:MAG TPA: hypothetical protein VKM55_08090 [Candidatus Lokiarchaeia archaeon]|nr:hypothetical protein [Candidatus Lokiarchaeia archaeon]